MASCCPEAKDSRHSSPYSCQESSAAGLTPDFPVVSGNAASCCGIQPSEPHASVENPGFRRWGFVEDFMETPAGPVPRVRTRLIREDRLGTVSARLGIGRDRYSIAPGIYGVGSPDKESPVMVTANYKLSFDALRCSLAGISAWILVLDTRSINVWCAAGKGTFSTREVAERVKATGLDKIVTHRCLILPQLSATGVAARQVKTLCGFEVIWGPVHARHINTFLENGMKATPAMRKVTFSFRERVELIPVELNHLGRPTLYLIPALFLLSGLGQGFFSVSARFLPGPVGHPGIPSGRGCRRRSGTGRTALAARPGLCPQGRRTGRLRRRHDVGCLCPPAGLVRNAGSDALHYGRQFLSGYEFYRVDTVHFPHRCRKGDAPGHPCPGSRCPCGCDLLGGGWIHGGIVHGTDDAANDQQTRSTDSLRRTPWKNSDTCPACPRSSTRRICVWAAGPARSFAPTGCLP